MIISFPFLQDSLTLVTQDENAEDALLQLLPPASATETNAPEGSYPLSIALAWHNGLHVQAPTAGGNSHQPVRAIADGTVVYAYAPTPKPERISPVSPLAYNPFEDSDPPPPAWTSDGFVVIKHTTEIGESVALTYYSAYMHLSSLANNPSTNAPWDEGGTIWRKDIIGQPGEIYGHPGQIHFEVCCDEANLQQIIKRTSTAVDPMATRPAPIANGRTDAVFGSTYIYLPANTPISTTDPTAATATDPAASPVPATLGTALWLKMSYEQGKCTYESLDLQGKSLGSREEDDAGYEYNLYTLATERHKALMRSNSQASSSPSGWYELLRFGRNLGPDALPEDAKHWRYIPGADGQALWTDLNATGTFKFSDADFLQVAGWHCFDDDSKLDDQRCESTFLKVLIRDPDPQNTTRMEPDVLAKRLGQEDVRKKLRRTICKFACEWDNADIAKRYNWVKTEMMAPDSDAPLDPGEAPYDEQESLKSWNEFNLHLNALSFADLPEEYKAAQWHFHPEEFIQVMRRCGWLSKEELKQLVPSKVVRGQGPGLHGPFFYERVSRNGGSLIANHHVMLNRTWRKYGVTTPARLAAFVGNSVQETTWWSTTEEGNGPTLRYAPWYGRGFLQLTNPDGRFTAGSNYWKYFEFRGRAVVGATPAQITQWRNDVAGAINRYDATDSAGAYWAWNNANAEADMIAANTRLTITLSSRSQMMAGASFAVYENVTFRRVACLINLPSALSNTNPQLNGLVDRYTAHANAQMILFDTPVFPDAQGQMQSFPEDFTFRRS